MDDKKLFEIHDSKINDIEYDYSNNLFFGISTLSNEGLLIKKAVEFSINGILITDLSGRITYVNHSFKKMWGYSDESEILGQLMIKFWKLKGKTMSIIDRIIDEGYWSGELVAQRNDDTEFHVKLSADLVRNKDHKPMAILATFIDISELVDTVEDLKNEKSMFHNIVEKSTDAIVVVDPAGIVQFANNEAKKIFTRGKINKIEGELFGLPVAKNDIMELDILNKKGEMGVGEMRVSPTKWDNKNAYLIQVRDITKHKKIQDELEKTQHSLQKTNDLLEDRVKERTKHIQKLLKQKDDFIGELGHDLKTPLSVLMNIIPLIQAECGEDVAHEDFKVAIRNVNYIRNLVKETLKIAELSSFDIEFEMKQGNFTEAVREIVDDYKMIAKAKGITIENLIDKDLIFSFDRVKIKELLSNLINNAIKFTPENGKVIIDYKTDFNQSVIISVRDTGIGLTEDQKNHIFDDFYKADVSRHDLGGSGLGLGICERIVERHGGLISADSPGLNKGTTISFNLVFKNGLKENGTK